MATMRNLLSLKRDNFEPQKLKIEDFIPKESMGRRNSIHELQNYVVGLSKDGLTREGDGSLDLDRSLVRLNYVDLLHEQTVRNNVQAERLDSSNRFHRDAHSARQDCAGA